MLGTILVLWGVLTVAIAIWWFTVPSSPDRALVRAGPLRRLARSWRAMWVRGFLWWASWPHVIDHVGGVHRAPVDPHGYDVVWTDGPVTLRRLHGARRRGSPILVVHALVSQPWILDLAPGHSLLGALVDAGFDVFVLDWGAPGRKEAGRGIAEYTATLLAAEEQVMSSSGADALHLAGYCSGATLCLIRLGGWSNDRVSSFAAIAPAVDLAVPGGMSTMMTSSLLKPVLLLDGDGCLPAAVIRESFHALRPEALRTVTLAYRRRRNPSYRVVYDPLARWAYEQRRIPGALFFDLVELHRTNALFDGGLSVSDRPIDLATVRAPTLIALALRDHIVPAASSLALASVLEAETLICPSGHVSLLNGERGREVLWPGLTAFFDAHERAPSVPAVRAPSRRRRSRPTPGRSSRSTDPKPGTGSLRRPPPR